MSNIPLFAPKPRLVVLALFPGFQILDAAGPLAAFEIAARFSGGAYRTCVAAQRDGLAVSSSGASMQARALSGLRNVDTLVVSGGEGTRPALQDQAFIKSVARISARARRTASVCSGAFILAAAGLLENKRATTHWRQAPLLQRLYPNVRVEPDCIHIQQDNIWTSAGVSAGIDLALAMIDADLGADVAASVAREMVVYAKRPGGQTQHSALLELEGGGRFASLNAWMREHLSEDLSVDALARRAAMGPRNFTRAYSAQTGMTPAKAVERMRLEAARAALEAGAAVKRAANMAGFGDPERMRRAFVRAFGVPPAQMRRNARQA